MRCRKVRSFLSAYCHDELNSRRKLAMSEHLLTCSACRREEDIYQQMADSSGQLASVEISDGFNTRLLNRIAQERFAETRTQAYLPKAAPLFSWKRVAPVMLTACLAMFAVISLTPNDDGSSPMIAADDASQTILGSDGDLDDLYLTVQPTTNPHMTVNMEKNWSLDRQFARAERIREISNSIIPAGSFGGQQYQLTSSRSHLMGRPVPYLLNQYRVVPVVKIYVRPQSTTRQEGNKPY
jgi:hypothetical protein